MKFGKSLSNQIEGAIPEWRDHFLSYKELKKRLKLIKPEGNENNRAKKRIKVNDDNEYCDIDISVEQFDFIMLLEAEVEKFNGFFEEKQEEYVIIIGEFKESVAKAKENSEELIKIRKEIVDFHGEMVLLENYSAFNFIGLVKILKKYDKRTGAVMRLPFIQKVLQQPFFTMDLLYELIKQCEDLLDRLFPLYVPSVQSGDRDEPSNPEYMENLYMRSAVSALRILKEIRSGSSTKSAFSLPPLTEL
ncbi:hypothetical protein ACHQM5_029084 [Ranunculus cassubicifolius]